MSKPKQENKRKIQGLESRRRLLLAAMAEFAEKGYHGASVRDIIGRSGHTVTAISMFFGSKEGLAEEIVRVLKSSLVTPVANATSEIGSDLAWRTAVKRFVSQMIGLFSDKTEPNCYFAALYRQEQARLHDKKVTLQDEIVTPVFKELEKLMMLGVEDRDPLTARLWTLALWNNVIVYALKHPDVLAGDTPEGMDGELFRATAIEFMVDKCIRDLKFTVAS